MKAITWTNADPVHWRIYAALGGDELSNHIRKMANAVMRLFYSIFTVIDFWCYQLDKCVYFIFALNSLHLTYYLVAFLHAEGKQHDDFCNWIYG